jgi:hypothetical protein
MDPELINAILNNPVEKVFIVLLVGTIIWIGKWLKSEITTNREMSRQQALDVIATFKDVNAMLDQTTNRINTQLRDAVQDLKSHIDTMRPSGGGYGGGFSDGYGGQQRPYPRSNNQDGGDYDPRQDR